MASIKGYGETILGVALMFFVLAVWAGSGISVLQDAELAFIGALVVGSIVYGLSMLYRGAGFRVGARGAAIYFAVMLIALLIRYLVFGPL